MSIKWHISREGEIYGPYSSQQVIAFIKEGRVDRRDWVWKDGMKGWVHVGSLDELADSFPAAAEQGGRQARKKEPRAKKPLSPMGWVLILCFLGALVLFGYRVYAVLQGHDRFVHEPAEIAASPHGEDLQDAVRLGTHRIKFDRVFADDTDDDGYLDRRSFYKDGLLVLTAWDTNKDGSFDLWLRFADGEYVDLEARDLSGDGQLDTLVRVSENEELSEERLLLEEVRLLAFYALLALIFPVLLILERRMKR